LEGREFAMAALLLALVMTNIVSPTAARSSSPLRLRQLGAYDASTAETTPVMWYGDLLIVEKIAGSARSIWLPGDVCKPNSTNGSPGVAPCTSRGSLFRIRQQALLGHGSNEPVATCGSGNCAEYHPAMTAGVNVVPGSVFKSFASAYVDMSNPVRPT
jgi:hypothetical protein